MTSAMVVLAHSPILVPQCTVSPSPPPTPVSCPALSTLKQGSVCLITDPSLQMKLLCKPPASNSREPMSAMDVGSQLAQTFRGVLPGPDQGQSPQVIDCRTGCSFKRRAESWLLLLGPNIPMCSQYITLIFNIQIENRLKPQSQTIHSPTFTCLHTQIILNRFFLQKSEEKETLPDLVPVFSICCKMSIIIVMYTFPYLFKLMWAQVILFFVIYYVQLGITETKG